MIKHLLLFRFDKAVALNRIMLNQFQGQDPPPPQVSDRRLKVDFGVLLALPSSYDLLFTGLVLEPFVSRPVSGRLHPGVGGGRGREEGVLRHRAGDHLQRRRDSGPCSGVLAAGLEDGHRCGNRPHRFLLAVLAYPARVYPVKMASKRRRIANRMF